MSVSTCLVGDFSEASCVDCEDVVGGERQWILVDMPVQFRDFFLVLLEISTVGVKRDEAREM